MILLIKTNKLIAINYIFYSCKELEYLDLSNFDTINVTSLRYMFNEYYNLKEKKGFDKFNTSKVTNIKVMFTKCQELESLDLSSFDTSNINDILFIFSECLKLREIKGLKNLLLINSNMEEMFQKNFEIKN